jgi:2-hydroxychromene-2-carboxylate isomerase
VPSADWYFDFVSPFSYLQCEQLPMLERSVRIRYRPVLFAGLLKAHGHKGPAEIASKRRFTYRFVVWQAAKLGIPLKFPAAHPFNPLPLLRLAIAADCEPSAVRRIFRFVWRDGRLGDLPIEWAELMSELDIPDAQQRIASPEVKDALKKTPTTPLHAASSACRRWLSAVSSSGAPTRRRWPPITSRRAASSATPR